MGFSWRVLYSLEVRLFTATLPRKAFLLRWTLPASISTPSEKYVTNFLTGQPKLQFLIIFKTPVLPLRGLTQFFLSYYHMNQVYFPTSFAAPTTESAPSIQHLIYSGVSQFLTVCSAERSQKRGGYVAWPPFQLIWRMRVGQEWEWTSCCWGLPTFLHHFLPTSGSDHGRQQECKPGSDWLASPSFLADDCAASRCRTAPSAPFSRQENTRTDRSC